jgi:Kelch motif/IPT/TIG domain
VRTIIVCLALVVAGCYSTSDVANGHLHCSAGGDCPEGFSCVENVCWRGGIVIAPDMSSMPGSDDMAGQTPDDLAGVDLHCTDSSTCPANYYCDIAAQMCMRQVAVDGACSADTQCGTNYCYQSKCTYVALSWLKVPTYTVSDVGVAVAALPFPDGRIFNIGGNDNPTSVTAFNVTTRTLTALAALTQGRWWAAATTAADGKSIYVSGGQTATDTYSSTYFGQFDGTTWYGQPLMRTARSQHACATLLSGIYCAGGIKSDINDFPPGPDVFASNAWSAAKAGLAGNHKWFSMPTLANTIYAVDGSTAWAFKDGDTAFTAIAKTATARYYFASAAGPDGRIYATGGQDGTPVANPAVYDSVEAYSPALDRWVTLTTKLNGKRQLHTAITGPDGRIYLVGGNDESFQRSQYVEAYGPDLKLSSTMPAGGDMITISGNNLAPSANVTVSFNGQKLASGTTDSFGGLNTITLKVPNVPAGGYSFVVVDNRSGYPITLFANIR